jgi:hypothetical protein
MFPEKLRQVAVEALESDQPEVTGGLSRWPLLGQRRPTLRLKIEALASHNSGLSAYILKSLKADLR